ncbi:MAG: LuxR family transcriptional regulator, partial [Paracoccaceae bacterium]|nr:LuxR family transcriptional regulator [Paracoccaceae bacterium]
MEGLPNASEAGLAQAINRLGQKGFEAELRGWLLRCLSFDNLIVLGYRDAGPPLMLFRRADQPQVFAELDSTYLAGAYLLDPYHDLHLSRVSAGVYRLRDIAPDAFQRSRYFQGYYQQTTLIDELTFVAYPVAGVT